MNVLLSLAFALPSFAALSPEGKFSYAHPIAFLAYDKKACLEDKGTWSSDDEEGLCLMDGSDDVSVSKAGDKFTVTVGTVTTNAHMCTFEGTAELKSENELIARQETQEYIPGENGGDGKLVPSLCELSVKFLDQKTLSVSQLSSRDSCEELCGMNAGLEIEEAIRQ